MNTDLALPRIASARRGSLMAALACFLSAALAVAAPFLPHVFDVLLAGSIAAAMVFYLALRSKSEPWDYFELFVPYSVLYFMYFGIGALFLKARPDFLPNISLAPYITPALALGTIGYLAFVGGYAGMAKRAKPSRAGELVPRGVVGVVVPGLVGLVGFAAGAIRIAAGGTAGAVSPLIPIVSQMSPIYYFAWYLVWHGFWSRTFSRTGSLVLISIFIPASFCVMYLTMGQKSVSIILMGTPAIAFWNVRRKLPLKTITVVLILAVFIVFPIYNTYRLQSRSLSIGQRLDQTVRVTSRWNTAQYAEESLVAFFGRFSIISAPAAVIRDAGRWVDFKKGETLILAPISLFIPRILWPEKPTIAIGHEFAKTFHLLAPGDRETHVAATPVGELYWNFHVPGVIAGMFLLGWLYRWLFKRYGSGSDAGPYRKAIYVAVLIMVMTGEGNLAMLLASLVKLLFLTHATLFLLRRLGWARFAEPYTPLTAA